MKRVIQENIKKPLANELLFGKLSTGGSVKVILKEGKISFEYLNEYAEEKGWFLQEQSWIFEEINVDYLALNMILPLVRSYGVNSTVTLSPVKILM